MKILRIIARLNVGGPARHVIWLSDGLARLGFETVLVSGVVPPGEDDMGYFAAAAGVTPLTVPQMSREISLKDSITIWKLYRLMLRERPDIVHTHTAKAGTVGRVAGLMYRWLTLSALIGKPRACRFVHTYHGHVFHSYYGEFKTKLFLSIERMLARLITNRIVVLSEQQRREINDQFHVGRAEQFAVVPLGLDLAAFAESEKRRPRLREQFQAQDDAILIGIVGRLTDVKNHDLFLRAAAHWKESNASQERPRVRFLIIGDGALRGDLEAQAKALGISAEVIFLGTRHDPENIYPALDIVALTSRNEGTPLTIIEAMANGCAVVATAVGGVIDLLGPEGEDEKGFKICERGLAVESGDHENFARALDRLIRDPHLRSRIGSEGRRFVEQHYSKDRLLRDIAALYDGL